MTDLAFCQWQKSGIRNIIKTAAHIVFALKARLMCGIIGAKEHTIMIFETVRDIIANQIGLDKSRITLESDIVNDLGLDSLDVVELIMAIEEEYGLVADDDTVATLKTVGDVVKYIEENK